MTEFKQLSKRYLLSKRKRSVLTAFGIILSIALIVTVGTMLTALRNTMYNEDVAKGGEYSVAYKHLTYVQMNRAQTSAGIKNQYTVAYLDRVYLEKFKQETADGFSGRFLNLNAVTGNGFSRHVEGYILEEGRCPKTFNEMTVESWMLQYLSPFLTDGTSSAKVDSRVTLDVGGTSHEFTITGIHARKGNGKLNFAGNAYIYSPDPFSLTEAINYTVYAFIPLFQDPAKLGNEILTNLKELGGTPEMVLNNYQLTLSGRSLVGEYNTSLLILFLVIAGIIVIASVSVIYNSFNIAVIERMNQFGTLRCIGATPGQIRALVRHEALVLCVIAIPFGIALGLAASFIVIEIIKSLHIIFISEYISGSVSWLIIGVSALLGLVTVLISVGKPARLASSVSPVEAVRGVGTTLEKNKKVKQGRLFRAAFGFEGDIAYRNTRRNKSRFRLTVFSMSISIILFLVFTSFGESLQSAISYNTIKNADFVIEYAGDKVTPEQMTAYKNDIQKMEGVQRSLLFFYGFGGATLPKERVSRQGGKYDLFADNKGETTDLQTFIVRGSKDIIDLLRAKVKSGIIADDVFESGDKVIVLSGKSTEGNYHTLRAGDDLKLYALPNIYNRKQVDAEAKKFKDKFTKLSIAGIVDDTVLGEKLNDGMLYVIVAPEVYDKVTMFKAKTLVLQTKKGANIDTVELNLQQYIAKTQAQLVYTNIAKAEQMNRNLYIVINIFVYGFVIVIVLISLLNIINTITTGILTRRRELSVLRAVGMDMQMLRRMTVLECFRYGVVSCFWGGAIGTLLSYVVGKSVMTFGAVDLSIDWLKIIIAFAVSMLIATLSAAVPVKRLKEQEIIEGIRAVE